MTDSRTDPHRSVTTLRSGSVAIITLPAALFDQNIRSALVAALDAASADPLIRAVILTGTGPVYISGAPAKDRASPTVGDICRHIETSEKPVVAALQGAAFGQGVELALAAHWRVALPEVRLGLSEIRIGLVPGAGATQRLPRLIGGAAAIRLLQSGDTVTAAEAMALGLVDEVVESGLPMAAMIAAQSLISSASAEPNLPHRQMPRHDFAGFQVAIAAERSRLISDPAALPASFRIVDCVEAAFLLPMEQGLAFEAAARDEIVDSSEVQGLTYAAATERRTFRRSALVMAVLPAPPSRVAALGTIAPEFVLQILGAGLQLRLVEQDRDRLVSRLGVIAALQEAQVQSGRLTPAARDADWARLIPTLTQTEAADAELWLSGQDARIVPTMAARPYCIALGGVVSGQSGMGLFPAKAAGLLAELSAAPDQPGREIAMAFCLKLGWRVVLSGGGGGIEKRLRSCLSAVISAQEASGLSRQVLAVALTHSGVGLPLAPQATPLPREAEDVATACLSALVNEGARLVGEGVAHCPGDVDTVAIWSGLAPRRLGGPMNWADQRGLLVLRADLLNRAAVNPEIYAPAPLIDRLIHEERHFSDLNQM